MKLARNVLANIEGTDIYAILGILIFFIFFLVVILWVMRIKANKAREYARMPLSTDEEEQERTNEKQHLA